MAWGWRAAAGAGRRGSGKTAIARRVARGQRHRGFGARLKSSRQRSIRNRELRNAAPLPSLPPPRAIIAIAIYSRLLTRGSAALGPYDCSFLSGRDLPLLSLPADDCVLTRPSTTPQATQFTESVFALRKLRHRCQQAP
jgi:hypothetical protein